MANLLIIADSQPERRARFLRQVEGRIAFLDGLEVSRCAAGDCAAIWAADPRAPVSAAVGPAGLAVLWGEAIRAPDGTRLEATALRRLWGAPDSPPPAFDGFYAAAVYDLSGMLIAGADLLGLFPLYYFSAGDVLLVGSSPELFRYHPMFRMAFDPQGLVGMLLTMHAVDGHTLLRGVRRLAAGHVLVWTPRTGPGERLQFRIPVSTRYFDQPFSDHVDLLDRALDEALRCHAPSETRVGQLLSGGRDSRLLAGYLAGRHAAVVALTLGRPTDFDMRCAVPVARTLGFEHRAAEIAADEYSGCAWLQARWEHAAGGFTTVHGWGTYPHLRGLPSRVVGGHLSDSIIGGSHIPWARDRATGAMSFEAFFARINAYGIRPETLATLLRRDIFHDLVPETIAWMRTLYEGYSDLEPQRAWCFDLYHRQRFHVGGEAWRLSFGGWPVLPAAGRTVLDTVGGIPAASLEDRRAQDQLLVRRFPKLAALPFADDPFRVTLKRPTFGRQVLLQVSRQRLNFARLAARARGRKLQPRYNARLYDINGPGWVAVRRAAEPYRDLAHGYFHRESMDAFLPAPDVPIACRDGIIDSSGYKTILGFLLWLEDHR